MKPTELFILVERERPVRDMNARYLESHLADGRYAYPSAEEAEEGR